MNLFNKYRVKKKTVQYERKKAISKFNKTNEDKDLMRFF